MFLGRSYFFIIIKKTVPAAMVINIGYQIFAQVINRVAKVVDYGHK